MLSATSTVYGLLLSIVSRRRFLTVLTVLSLGLFVLMQLLFRTQLAGVSGLGVPPVPPDGRAYYTAHELIAMLEALGPAGRLVYLRLHLLDMLFPLVYGLFFASLIVYFWGVRRGASRAASLLTLVPVIGSLADLIENASIRVVSAAFSDGRTAADVAAFVPGAAALAGAATAVKWVAAALCVLLILAGAIAVACVGEPERDSLRPPAERGGRQ